MLRILWFLLGCPPLEKLQDAGFLGTLKHVKAIKFHPTLFCLPPNSIYLPYKCSKIAEECITSQSGPNRALSLSRGTFQKGFS